MVSIPGVSGLELVAAAANAHVYSGVDDLHERPVAVKVLRIGDEAVSRRFERERRAMGRLSDIPNVASIYTSGFTDAGEPFIVMPLYSGSLQSQVDETGPLLWQTAVATMLPVGTAIARSHDFGVLHLDLKPSNILLDTVGDPHVADFGISVFLEATGSLSGSMLTPDYSPPERFDDVDPSQSTDVYGLGATLFALLAGRAPFASARSTGPAATMRRILTDPLPLDRLPRDLPAQVVEVIDRAMVKDPEQRTPTAAEFVDGLRSVSGSSPLRIGPTSPPTGQGPDLPEPEAESGVDSGNRPDASFTQVAAAAMSDVVAEPAAIDDRGPTSSPTGSASRTQAAPAAMSDVLIDRRSSDGRSSTSWRAVVASAVVVLGLAGVLVAIAARSGQDARATDTSELESADTTGPVEDAVTTTSNGASTTVGVATSTTAPLATSPSNPVATISLGIPTRLPAVASSMVFIPSANSREIRRVDAITFEELEPITHPSGPGDAATIEQAFSQRPFLVGVGSAILDDFVIYDGETGEAVAELEIPDQSGHVLGVDRDFWVFGIGEVTVVQNSLDGVRPSLLEPIDLGCSCSVTESSVVDGLVYAASFGRITVLDPSTRSVVGAVEFERDSPSPPVEAGGLLWTHVSVGEEVIAFDPQTLEIVERIEVLETVTGLASSGNALVAAGFTSSRVLSAEARAVSDSIGIGGDGDPLVVDGLVFMPDRTDFRIFDLSTTRLLESHLLDFGESSLGGPRNHQPFLVLDSVWYISEGGELIVVSPFLVARS